MIDLQGGATPVEVHLLGYELGAVGSRHAHCGGQADLYWKRRRGAGSVQMGVDGSGLQVRQLPWSPAHSWGKLVL